MVEVVVRIQDPEGSDPWEETLELAHLPRKDDLLEVWISPEIAGTHPSNGGHPQWLEVEYVSFATYGERIEVWVRRGDLNDADLALAFKSIREKTQP